jgi:hypothetical protein
LSPFDDQKSATITTAGSSPASLRHTRFCFAMMRRIPPGEKRDIGLPDIDITRASRCGVLRHDGTRIDTSNERLTGGGDEAQHDQRSR